MNMRTRLFIVVISAGVAIGLAHDIALFPRMRDSALEVLAKYGHPGDYLPASPSKLVELTAYTPEGKIIACEKTVKQEGESLLVSVPRTDVGSGTWLFAARYDNGFYVKMPDGRSVNTTKLEVPNAVTATHNFKLGKALFARGPAGPGYDRVVGHKLELIPQRDPLQMKVGGELPVVVRFDGKPLRGVGVEIGDGVTPIKETAIIRYKTNASGTANVPIQRSGLQLIAVDHNVPSVSPMLATEDAYTATLVFTLKP